MRKLRIIIHRNQTEAADPDSFQQQEEGPRP
jgi:hypothetical protein